MGTWVALLFCIGITVAAANPPHAKPASTPSFLPKPKAPSAPPSLAVLPEPQPSILPLLKPSLHKRILEDREAITSATLDDEDAQKNRLYHLYAVMLVRAPLALTRKILTDYALYSKMISYVDRADYDPKRKTLLIEGGIWSFKLRSLVLFDERGPGWIHYQITGGHFRGLQGDFLLEEKGPGQTLVLMRGEQTGSDWPPKFVIERGAEIVFGFTARRMRTYIESQKTEAPAPHGQASEIPQPRSHL